MPRDGIDMLYSGGPYFDSVPRCIAGFQSIHSTREPSRESQTR